MNNVFEHTIWKSLRKTRQSTLAVFDFHYRADHAYRHLWIIVIRVRYFTVVFRCMCTAFNGIWKCSQCRIFRN